jgi:SAM-dependent MidA family methyltransferase
MKFSRFMELALYDPLDGYYASGRAAVGKGGDFFTNVSIGPVYGEVLAGQIVEMWELLGRPTDFTLVEQGANDGRLSRDIFEALPYSLLQNAKLVLIEPLPVLQKKTG